MCPLQDLPAPPPFTSCCRTVLLSTVDRVQQKRLQTRATSTSAVRYWLITVCLWWSLAHEEGGFPFFCLKFCPTRGCELFWKVAVSNYIASDHSVVSSFLLS